MILVLPVVAGCSTGLSDEKLPLTVSIPQDCERLASTVPHAPVSLHKTDARVAYWAEHDRLDTANDRLSATRRCQTNQRLQFGSAKKGT